MRQLVNASIRDHVDVENNKYGMPVIHKHDSFKTAVTRDATLLHDRHVQQQSFRAKANAGGARSASGNELENTAALAGRSSQSMLVDGLDVDFEIDELGRKVSKKQTL